MFVTHRWMRAALAAGAAGLAAAAYADGAEPTAMPHARLFQEADTDADGTISAAEAQTRASTRFDQLDLDHDGLLTLSEFRAPVRSTKMLKGAQVNLRQREARFHVLDANGDGKISKDELLSAVAAGVSEADADRDGTISNAELAAAGGSTLVALLEL
jgi:Ca2+-binding EF-hand superfamily protein